MQPRTSIRDKLAESFIGKFVPKFVPGGEVVYVKAGSPTINNALIKALGLSMDSHQSMPDAMVYCRKRNWLFVAESASGNGLIDEEHAKKLAHQFSTASTKLIFVSVFQNRSNLTRYPGFPAWGTNVWFADEPDHMMHFD
ncbi:MAG: BsuBI/PstI family type II restriction endonuclease [Pseudomonadota bacterium]